MPVLRNPRHEKFSQLVASGIKPTEAYVSLGYSKAGAPQSANKLLKRNDVRERVNEIQSQAARSTADGVILNRERVLHRLSELSHEAQQKRQYSAAARCEELIGKEIGMFVDHSDHTFQFDLDPTKMTDEQLAKLQEWMLSQACGGDPTRIAETRRQLEIEAGRIVDVVAVPASA